MTLIALRGRLLDAYGRERLTPTVVLACHSIADLAYDLVKPSAMEAYITTPSPAYNNLSLLDCVRSGDLDTPLGVLMALAEGTYT